MSNAIPKLIAIWAEMISERNPKNQTSLYSKNAILLPTFQNFLLGEDGVMEYMIKFLNKEKIKCKIVKNYTQKNKDSKMQIASGIYEFSYTENSKQKRVKARYTFVIKNNLIICHHSSINPNT